MIITMRGNGEMVVFNRNESTNVMLDKAERRPERRRGESFVDWVIRWYDSKSLAGQMKFSRKK